jgi:hypothetical protein
LKGLIKETDRLAIAGCFMVSDDVNRDAHALEFDFKVLVYREIPLLVDDVTDFRL